MQNPETPDRENLQAKKHALVRGEVTKAAIDLFHSKGFDQVTVEEIACRAGVSRRTFFRYFTSKEDVLASGVREFVGALSDAIAGDDSKATALEVAKRAIPSVLRPYFSGTQQVLQIAKRSVSARNAQLLEGPLVQEKLVKAFAERENRAGQPQLEDRVLAALTLLATALCVEMWVEQHEQSLSDIVEEVFSTFHSLCHVPDRYEKRIRSRIGMV